MMETFLKYKIVALSALLSLLMFAFFFYVQSKEPELLKLDGQWVAVSVLPVLVGLFVSGYISKFKGFGIELESKLEAPVSSIQLTATDAVDELPGNEKESVGDLHQITERQKREARRISFNLDKKNYYGSHAIEKYIDTLPNIEYLEVKKENGEFVCLLPISLFKVDKEYGVEVNTKYEAINRFRISLDENTVLSEFSEAVITLTVQSSSSLIEVLRTLRTNDSYVAAVVSKERKLVGVITAALVEKRIADEVLGTRA
jgi:hypothetical protein